MSEENTQVIVDTATRAADPAIIDASAPLHTVVVPAGGELRIIDTTKLLEPYQAAPARKKGTVALTTPASLSQYVNAHKVGGTDIYADWRATRAVAVLNDHSEADAGWGDHRAVLTLQLTPEWKAWLALDSKYMPQTDFAEHIIDTAADIIDPPTADLLEMAETFQAQSSVQFKSGNRLQNGQRQLTYIETVDAQAGRGGNVTIPDAIRLFVAPFDGAEPVEMGARFRYRINGGDLRLGYVLDRPDLVLRTAFAAVVAGIESETHTTALWGTPRS